MLTLVTRCPERYSPTSATASLHRVPVKARMMTSLHNSFPSHKAEAVVAEGPNGVFQPRIVLPEKAEAVDGRVSDEFATEPGPERLPPP